MKIIAVKHESNEPTYTTDELAEIAEDFDINQTLKEKGYQDEALSFEEAYTLGAFTLYGLGEEELEDVFETDQELASRQSLAALCTFHNQANYRSENFSEPDENAAEQIAGITAAVFDYDIGTSEYGFVDPDVDTAMDNCGTGGDTFRTPNVSTLAALTAASDGVNMLKHGSPGNTDSTGSSDFLDYLGFEQVVPPETSETSVEENSFGYTEALNEGYKKIHTQTHEQAQLAHMNDIIGPITNPMNPETHTQRVIGVNHLALPETYAEAYKVLNEKDVTNVDHLFAVRGFVEDGVEGGIDEISTMPGGSQVAELKDGEIETMELTAEDFGLEPSDYRQITPDNYDFSKPEMGVKMLKGEIENDSRDLIAANAALLFNLDRGMDLEEGTQKAIDILESGKAYENAKEAAEITQR